MPFDSKAIHIWSLLLEPRRSSVVFGKLEEGRLEESRIFQ